MTFLLRVVALSVLISSAALAADAVAATSPRERVSFDAGWRFAFGHPSDPLRDFNYGTGYFSDAAKAGYGEGAASADFDDRAWRQLDLPHDWAVEAPFDPRASYSHGFKAVGRAFPDRAIGWYRKHFAVAPGELGRRISIEFDGVFRDAVVWINGFRLGRHESGYTSFAYDITDYLNYGGENVVVVRADATKEEGWYYEGAGIYRHVWLAETSPLHVARWGTFVSCEVQPADATVSARTTVTNDDQVPREFVLFQSLVGPDGTVVATGESGPFRLSPGESHEYAAQLSVKRPKLWSVDQPQLHQLVTTLRAGVEIADRYETTFGIRTIRFDPDRGFFLNGQPLTIKGTNNHVDHAGVGVAVPDLLVEYRIRKMKELGSNAWRCSHHPPAPEFLDACDRLGMLVLDENRLMGTSPDQLGQLEDMIRRDRNHPSVILWSLGNEEWGIEGNVKGARIAATMQAVAHRLDPTRLDTVGISGGWGTGISTVLDVMGYNYISHGDTDKQHAAFPRQSGIGTEETTMQDTRGVYFRDEARGHQGPQANGNSGNNLVIGWQHYAARPYLAGVFFWTGFDYRGEPTPFGFPAHSSQFGILDTCGFPKNAAPYLRAWWTTEPVLELWPHWNWPGRDGQEITVTCDSNHEEVELLLNGRSLGKKSMPRNGRLTWTVAYAPGVLEARGFRHGQLVGTSRVETTGPAQSLVLTPDHRTRRANEDIVIFTVSARDAQGRPVPDANDNVRFEVEGGMILGLGNGDPGSLEADQFHEQLSLVEVDDWRGRIVSAGAEPPATTLTLDPMTRLGHWKASLPKSGEVYDLTAQFTLESFPPASASVALYLPSLGAKTSVWLNGRELARDTDTSKSGPALNLDPRLITVGRNRLLLRVTPFPDAHNHIPELTRIGSVRIIVPPPPAQRRLFNGLAQVIVRTDPSALPLKLRASAEALSPSESVIR